MSKWKGMKEGEAVDMLEREGSSTEHRKHGLGLSPRGRCRELLDRTLTMKDPWHSKERKDLMIFHSCCLQENQAL